MRRTLPLALLLSACARAPAGMCPFDLGGEWVNASDSRYGYRLRDQGGAIEGEAFQREPSGRPVPAAPGEPAVTMRLVRGQSSLAGAMRSPARSLSGKACLVDFALRVSACEKGRLQIVAEMTAPLGDDCARLDRLADGGSAAQDFTEFVWVRPSTD